MPRVPAGIVLGKSRQRRGIAVGPDRIWVADSGEIYRRVIRVCGRQNLANSSVKAGRVSGKFQVVAPADGEINGLSFRQTDREIKLRTGIGAKSTYDTARNFT